MNILLRGLLYLWIRDAGLPLNDETAAYITEHLRAAYRGAQYSNKEIAQFVSDSWDEFWKAIW